jgi:preprotein translocase subunit SecY
VSVNLLAILALSLSDVVPLINLDLRTVPLSVLQNVLAYGYLLPHATGPTQFSPFILSIVPYIQAQMFLSLLLSFDMLGGNIIPAYLQISKETAGKAEQQQRMHIMVGVLGTALAALLAVPLATAITSLTGSGPAQTGSVACAIIAGSAMHQMLANLITHHGLGNGSSFLYLMLISNSALPSLACHLCTVGPCQAGAVECRPLPSWCWCSATSTQMNHPGVVQQYLNGQVKERIRLIIIRTTCAHIQISYLAVCLGVLFAEEASGGQAHLPRGIGMYVCRLLHIGRIRMEFHVWKFMAHLDPAFGRTSAVSCERQEAHMRS